MILILRRFSFTLLAALLVTPMLSAQSGTIAGRVFNPSTGEYVRNAQIRVTRTEAITTTEGDGTYRLTEIKAGDVTLVVNFTGYQPISATVRVLAGETVTQDFKLISSLTRPAVAGEPIKMSEFVVSSERDGNAKAIMNQKNSMNITNSVSSDSYGDNAEGNVGEFVKNLPGVELELVEGVARNFRLRGLASEYASVTLDGVTLASADGNTGAAGNARAFSFEQVSLSSMEAIEVSKTVSADVDANAPAGTVNLRTKRAFDRQNRRIAWLMNVTAFSSAFNFDKSYGPDDQRRRKILPGGILEYSDVFFERRLGVVLNISESNLYSESNRIITTYNYTPTTADPRPAVVTAISRNHGPRTNERFATTLTTDFKATPRLVLSMGLIYNSSTLLYVTRNHTFNTGARATIVGADPMLSFKTASAASVSQTSTQAVKLGWTRSYFPKFDYKVGDLLVSGRFAMSDAVSTYDPLGRYNAVRNANGSLGGVSFQATRSSIGAADWQIAQLSGADWADGRNFLNPIAIVNDGRFARTTVYSGQIDTSLKTRRFLPVDWKTGVKRKEEYRKFEVGGEALTYAFVGPGGGPTGNWGAFQSLKPIDLGKLGANDRSISGRQAYTPNFEAIGSYYLQHPDEFTQVLTATNYYNAYIANKKNYVESNDAAYFMGTTKVGKLQLRAGYRWEDTETDSLEFDPRTPAEMKAAGFAVVNGIATTIPGVQYQYQSLPRVHRVKKYDNYFPSASAKYIISEHLQAQLGYSHTIRRPTFRDIAGVWVIDDVSQRVFAPNPALRPEVSDNYATRLAYYFEPVGNISINFYENRVIGAGITTQQSAAEYGYDGSNPELLGYTFISTVSSAAEVRIRGMEIEYSQSLSFLPAPFNGLNIYANYSRNYASIVYPLMTPHSVKGGFSYSLGRLSLNTNYTWSDTFPTSTILPRFQRHRSVVTLGGSCLLTKRTSLFFSVQNLTNTPEIQLEKSGANPTVANNIGVYGAQWTFGLKGSF